jgi:hypothetical protein
MTRGRDGTVGRSGCSDYSGSGFPFVSGAKPIGSIPRKQTSATDGMVWP